MGTISELWAPVSEPTTLFQDGQSQEMGSRAFACPNGVLPSELDWSSGGQETLSYAKTWTNQARESFALSSGTQLRIGCTWSYGGRSAQHAGFFLHDAYLWAVLDFSSVGTSFEVVGCFGEATAQGNSAELAAWIRVAMCFLGADCEECRFDVRIRGDGSGILRPA